MMTMHSAFSQKAIAFNMSKGNSEVLRLLQGLPAHELVVLQKNEDLLGRVQEFAEINVCQITQILQSDFGLDVKLFNNGEMWIDTDNLEDAVPSWFRTEHIGWYLKTEDLLKFGQGLLLDELRMNIYLRYLESRRRKITR